MRYKQLTEIERYQIKSLFAVGLNQKMIAIELGRSPSTISRELKRNTGLRGYRPQQAQRLTEERRSHRVGTRILESTWVKIEELLRLDWSPEQISKWLPTQNIPTVSHEWIYQYILKNKSNGGDLAKHLRCRKIRKKRYGKPNSRGQIKNRISIDERPAIVDQKIRKGDWEIDTVIGQIGGAVLVTAAERKTKFSVVALAANKSAEAVSEALIKALDSLNVPIKTMTYDNGKEFAYHEKISSELNAKAYFAHPYHSWERGLNENMNGLIRQYAPKGSDFNKLNEDDTKFIMNRLNNRPRKCLNYKTPNEVMFGRKLTIAFAS